MAVASVKSQGENIAGRSRPDDSGGKRHFNNNEQGHSNGVSIGAPDHKSERKEAGKRLLKARVAAGYFKVLDVCREFGWNYSTYRAHERGQNPFTLEQAILYGQVYGVSPVFLAFGESPASGADNSKSFSGAPERGQSRSDMELSQTDFRRAIDVISSGYWRKQPASLSPSEFADKRSFLPFISEFDPESQCDFFLRDSSMDRVAPNGFYLRCLKISDGSVAVQSGDLVVLERMRENALRELSLRRLQFSGECLLLNPESSESHWESIIVRNGKDLEGTSSRLIAKVLFVYCGV